ncbi:hypothetical protein [Bacillus salipaludis]|uniref:hypothetical protein n=1 Tax=Bacillus salipaludis TaxID=2547811 RepID=UPI002E1B9F07|nr:hypothetical protein [Bacillus salipaludis]
MLNGYMMKMNLIVPKATIQLDKKVYGVGTNINGSIELKGGLIKNKVKRYDIDLIKEDPNSHEEETINSHTVLFSYSSLPDKSETIPFTFYIPESIRKDRGSLLYTLIIRIVLANSKSITQCLPIMINNENGFKEMDEAY